jgi:hypothetical protein
MCELGYGEDEMKRKKKKRKKRESAKDKRSHIALK